MHSEEPVVRRELASGGGLSSCDWGAVDFTRSDGILSSVTIRSARPMRRIASLHVVHRTALWLQWILGQGGVEAFGIHRSTE